MGSTLHIALVGMAHSNASFSSPCQHTGAVVADVALLPSTRNRTEIPKIFNCNEVLLQIYLQCCDKVDKVFFL